MAQAIPPAGQSPTAAMAVRVSARAPIPAAPQKIPAATANRPDRQQLTATTRAKVAAEPAVGSGSRPPAVTASRQASKPQPPAAKSVTVKAGTPAVSKARLEQTAGPGRQKPAKVASRVHVVKPGETLADIAKRYRIGLADLRSANGLGSGQSGRLPAGASLTIPASGDSG